MSVSLDELVKQRKQQSQRAADIAELSGNAPPPQAEQKSQKHGGGGILGGIENAAGTVKHGVESGAHDVANGTLSLATGLYDLGKTEGQAISDDLHGRNNAVNKREWSDLFHGHLVRAFHEADKGDATPAAKGIADFERSAANSSIKSATSPSYIAHHPFTAVLNDLALFSGGATAAAKLGYLSKVANTARVAETGALVEKGSDAAKAAEAAGHTVTPLSAQEKATLAAKTLSPTHRVPQAERMLSVPKEVAPAAPTAEELAAARKLKNKVNARVAVKRGEKTGISISEQPIGPTNLTHEAVQIGTASHTPLYRGVQKLHDTVAQKALDNGINAATQTRTAKYAEKRVAGGIGELTRVTRNVRAADVTKVSRAAKNLDKGAPSRLAELAMFLRSANVTGKEAADFWKAQAEAGVGDRIKVGHGVGQLRTAHLAKLAQAIHDRGLLKVGEDGNVAVDAVKYPKLAAADQAVKLGQDTREGIIGDRKLMNPEGMRTRLDLVGQKILGDAARPGQGFVTLKTSVKGSPQSGVARTRGSVIPLVKSLSLGKKATGKGIAKGLVPVSTTKAVARGLSEALRFVNSDELRGQVAKLGSDAKRTGDDILIRDPAADKATSTLSQHIQEILGRSESTVTEPGEDTLRQAAKKLLTTHIRGLEDNFAKDKAAAIGERAPKGYKWVPKQLVPDELTSAVEPRGRIEKFADTVNSAVTTATVYLKLGHLPTRLLTNLSTNVVQGSAPDLVKTAVGSVLEPLGIAKSVTLANKLSDEQKLDLLAATGTHGYQALPHAGTNLIARVATKGANAWARHIDAPFRLNAILYELRDIGIDSPEAVDRAIAQLKDPTRSGMSASEISKLDGAVRRSNRAGIMYDGLSAAEKRNVARYVWFYPWTKGAARFAGHTVAEHPLKSAIGGQIGQQGADYRQSILGNVPGYELGLTPFTSGQKPLTGTLSSFTPFSTAGDVAQLAAHPLSKDDGLLGQLNPSYSALALLVADLQAGKKNALGDALHELALPTPEAQVVNAYRHPPGPTRMFGVTPLGVNNAKWASVVSALARAAAGPAVPRPTNRTVLNRVAR